MSQEHGPATFGDPMSSLRPETVDRVLGALADERRRATVAYLTDANRSVSRDELVHQVMVDTVDPARVDGDVLEQLTTQFHHRHLPKLTAAGLVDYDETEEVVYATETAHRVSRLIAGI